MLQRPENEWDYLERHLDEIASPMQHRHCMMASSNSDLWEKSAKFQHVHPTTAAMCCHPERCRKADKWPTWCWPGLFYSQLHQPACAATQSGARKQTNGPPGTDQAFLQLAATSAMCCHPERCTHLPHPVPPLISAIVQNLSSKRIAPTDNMQPKSDNAKTVSLVGEGLNRMSILNYFCSCKVKSWWLWSWQTGNMFFRSGDTLAAEFRCWPKFHS